MKMVFRHHDLDSIRSPRAMALSWLTVCESGGGRTRRFYSFLAAVAFCLAGSALLHLSRLVAKLEDRVKLLEEWDPLACGLTRACSGLAHRLRLFARR